MFIYLSYTHYYWYLIPQLQFKNNIKLCVLNVHWSIHNSKNIGLILITKVNYVTFNLMENYVAIKINSYENSIEVWERS